MRVQLQNDPLAFSEELLDIGNDKSQLFENIQYIRFLENFVPLWLRLFNKKCL